ncbi:MAG: glycosyltransferase [Brevinematia bacterium]
MSNFPKVSIIIPAVRLGDFIREAIPHYEKLDYDNFEVIIVVNEENFVDEKFSDKLSIKVIPGPLKLGEKRDKGFEVSSGDIIAFIDDDAYPRSDWLSNAVKIFNQDESVGIVGGPAITPEDEEFWNKISGNIYSSFLMSGSSRKKFILTKGDIHEDDDIHGVNLLVRRSVFSKVGGFKDISYYFSGEDTLFCLKVKKAGYKIIFSPDVVVYHHRRSIFFDHFKQIANYGFHRGFFVRKFPDNSFKVQYFLPSLFLLGVVFGGFLSIFSDIIFKVYLATLGVYFSLAFLSSLKLNIVETLFTTLGIFFSHLTYGFFFIKGLLTNDENYREEYHKKMVLSQKRFSK